MPLLSTIVPFVQLGGVGVVVPEPVSEPAPAGFWVFAIFESDEKLTCEHLSAENRIPPKKAQATRRNRKS